MDIKEMIYLEEGLDIIDLDAFDDSNQAIWLFETPTFKTIQDANHKKFQPSYFNDCQKTVNSGSHTISQSSSNNEIYEFDLCSNVKTSKDFSDLQIEAHNQEMNLCQSLEYLTPFQSPDRMDILTKTCSSTGTGSGAENESAFYSADSENSFNGSSSTGSGRGQIVRKNTFHLNARPYTSKLPSKINYVRSAFCRYLDSDAVRKRAIPQSTQSHIVFDGKALKKISTLPTGRITMADKSINNNAKINNHPILNTKFFKINTSNNDRIINNNNDRIPYKHDERTTNDNKGILKNGDIIVNNNNVIINNFNNNQINDNINKNDKSLNSRISRIPRPSKTSINHKRVF
ncbi:putative uncharacterized protein DDB_G0289263 isoform X2 [Gordionus sp. m RMFG-2023]|uniref:putative uncharacterized protein DDB_G0289263 isoform X2 n=1 Tax=Gordionus sp. m RMFG-2023 TaxID=3053472 RepID=UPI0031FC125D